MPRAARYRKITDEDRQRLINAFASVEQDYLATATVLNINHRTAKSIIKISV